VHRGLEHLSARFVAEKGLGAAVRMRHQADDVAFAVSNARDPAIGAVWVGGVRDVSGRIAVAEDDAIFPFERVELPG